VIVNVPHRAVTAASRQPRIQIFHAYALMCLLYRLTPYAEERATRRIASAAVHAIATLKRGLEISCHPFEGAGLDLVLSARWSKLPAILTIDVDVRPTGSAFPTVVGPLPAPKGGRRRDPVTARAGSRSRC
jgi:hypothetical protein